MSSSPRSDHFQSIVDVETRRLITAHASRLYKRYNSRTMVELSVKPLKKIDIISVAGRIDSANVGELEVALKGLQERGRHKLILDFEKLDYISSAGLRAMVAALKTARSSSGDVVLVKPNERIRDTLSLVGFQSLFVQYDDLLDAVDAF